MKITHNVPTAAFTLKASATWDVLFDDNNKAVAIFSRKSRLAELAMIAPDMYELLDQMVAATNDTANMMSAAYLAETLRDLSSQARQLMAKMQGGGE